MKKLLVIMSAIVMLTSCSQDSEFIHTTNSCKEVTLQLGGDFSLESVVNLTRSSDIREADGEMEYYTLTEGDWCRTSAYMEVLTANDETLASAKIVTADLERGKCSLYSGSFAYTSNTAKGTTFNFSIPEWEVGTQGTW